MDNPLLERRMLLRGVGVAGASMAGVAAVTAPASAHDGHDEHDLLGSWLITHSNTAPSPPEPGTTVVGFAPGGLLVTQDIAPVGTAGIGTWESRGHDRFKASFWSGIPAEGAQPAALIKFSVRGRVEHDAVSGTYRGQLYDTAMHALPDGFEGTFSGVHVDA